MKYRGNRAILSSVQYRRTSGMVPSLEIVLCRASAAHNLGSPLNRISAPLLLRVSLRAYRRQFALSCLSLQCNGQTQIVAPSYQS